RRGAHRAVGPANVSRNAPEREPVAAVERGGFRQRPGAAGIALSALRGAGASPAGDLVEHRRDGAHREPRARAAAAGRTPPGRIHRWNAPESRVDADAIHGARGLPGRAHASGRDRRRERDGAGPDPRRDVHGAADQHPEPEQSYAAGAAEHAARSPELTASSGDASRLPKPDAGAGRAPRARKLQPDPNDILQAQTTALVVLDGDLAIAYMNPSAESLLGVSVRQAAGRALRD